MSSLGLSHEAWPSSGLASGPVLAQRCLEHNDVRSVPQRPGQDHCVSAMRTLAGPHLAQDPPLHWRQEFVRHSGRLHKKARQVRCHGWLGTPPPLHQHQGLRGPGEGEFGNLRWTSSWNTGVIPGHEPLVAEQDEGIPDKRAGSAAEDPATLSLGALCEGQSAVDESSSSLGRLWRRALGRDRSQALP